MACALYWNDVKVLDGLTCQQKEIDFLDLGEKSEPTACFSIPGNRNETFYKISRLYVYFADEDIRFWYPLTNIIIENSQCGCPIVANDDASFSEDVLVALVASLGKLNMKCVRIENPSGGDQEWVFKASEEDFCSSISFFNKDITYFWNKGFQKLKTSVALTPEDCLGTGYLIDDTCGIEYASTKNQFSLQMIFPELVFILVEQPLFLNDKMVTKLIHALAEMGQSLVISQQKCKRSYRHPVKIAVQYGKDIVDIEPPFVLQDDVLDYFDLVNPGFTSLYDDTYEYNPRHAIFNLQDIHFNGNLYPWPLYNSISVQNGYYKPRFITSTGLSVLIRALKKSLQKEIYVDSYAFRISDDEPIPSKRSRFKMAAVTILLALPMFYRKTRKHLQ